MVKWFLGLMLAVAGFAGMANAQFYVPARNGHSVWDSINVQVIGETAGALADAYSKIYSAENHYGQAKDKLDLVEAKLDSIFASLEDSWWDSTPERYAKKDELLCYLWEIDANLYQGTVNSSQWYWNQWYVYLQATIDLWDAYAAALADKYAATDLGIGQPWADAMDEVCADAVQVYSDAQSLLEEMDAWIIHLTALQNQADAIESARATYRAFN